MNYLSTDEVQRLGRQAQEGDTNAEARLLENSKHFIISRAIRFERPGLDRDDLIQTGLLAVIEAIRKWDFNSRLPFKAILPNRITNALVEASYRGRTVHVTRWWYDELARPFENTSKKLSDALGRPPTDREVFDALGWGRGQVDSYRSGVNAMNNASFDSFHSPPIDDDLVEFVWDSASLSDAVGKLPPGQQDLIRQHFYEGKTIKEIARSEGKDWDTVQQKKRRAMEKLRYLLGLRRRPDSNGVHG